MSPLELFTQAWMTWAFAVCGSTKPRKIDATATAVRLNDIRIPPNQEHRA
jgi:hypothetical protein